MFLVVGGKNSSDRSFMADIVYWVYQNPPPAHFFLISGDKDFANILHRLRMSNYNILLASTETASGVLCSAATIMWPWNGLVKGENLTVRHFNHPPDGLYGSWYGHFKGLLDDPFADSDHPTTSQPEESMELISELKPRPVPRVVVNAIRQVLHSYPEGISLTELRSELKRNNITIDKDFFGYKKFSLFLASLNLLKFVPSLSGDRQPLVVSMLRKGAEQFDIRSRLSKEVCINGVYKDNGFTRKGESPMDKMSISAEHPSSFKESNLNSKNHPVVGLEGRKGDSVARPTILDPSNALQQKENIEVKEGLLKKIWKRLRGHRVGSVLKKDDNILVVDSSSHEDYSKNAPNMQSSGLFMQIKQKDEVKDPNNLFFEKGSSEKSIAKDDNSFPSEKSNNVNEQRDGLLGTILRWSKSWIYGTNEQDDHSDSSDKAQQIDAACKSGKAHPFSNSNPAVHELFSNSHFWDELEAFLLDPKNFHLILKSRTREQFLQMLQNEGPSSLKELNNNNLSQLGNILFLEKKWVEETASQKFPFKVTVTAKKKSILSQPYHLNGLSSLFPAKTKPDSPKLQDEEKEEHNSVSIGFSQNGTAGKKAVPHSRDEILSHCSKLLEDLLQKNPSGFNISIFQPEFVKKYGYILDCNALGYPKLAALLKIMPDIRIENSYIQSSEIKEAKEEDGEGQQALTENSRFDDSAWDELGPPLSNPPSDENGREYSPVSLSDDEYTDSEEEICPPSDRSGRREQSPDDSSLLLKILDSWDGKKEDDKEKERDFNGLVDCSRNENQKASQKLKLRTGLKNHAFVTPDEDDKQLFAERIVRQVMKAGDSRLKG
ncbi:uncharacterized protein LOC110020008 [Phalaenopsis equestris]|uniref:uncharacterized protein LOC110020008 n=1 Tax=Phalaenopsis equestris TaxID=78828 RepID=UPI0009E261BE|nr:uncharacterized protein LOC110020008 [Phalaenopsis equestris]